MGLTITRRRALRMFGVGALVPIVGCREGRNPSDAPSATAAGETLHYLGLNEIARCIQSRKLASADLTRQMLDRIARIDPILESYATVMADGATTAARRADDEIARGTYRGPLHGVPIAVKDLCYTQGVRTMGGTSVLKDFVPDVDATVVARLRDAGAVVLGKLNLTEGAMGGYHPDFGVPRNPWDTGRWPGLSSSGSGVATAAGLCFAATGTDTGGSIRMPASANGVVGLKPTYGRVSRFGVLALSESLDHVGPMGRRVVDVAIVYDAIAGHDPKDTTSLAEPAERAVEQIGRGVEGLRIGIDQKYALDGIDPGQATSLEEALKVLAGLGARIVDVQMPDRTGLVEAWLAIATAEAVTAHQANYPSRASEYGPYFRQVLAMGSGVSPEQLAAARRYRAAFTERFTALLDAVDAVACPAGGSPAFVVTRELQVGPLPELHKVWDAALPRTVEFTMPMAMAGTPAICLPSGFSPEGLPYSIQFAGRRLSEPMLCRIAHAYESATDWHARHPPAFA